MSASFHTKDEIAQHYRNVKKIKIFNPFFQLSLLYTIIIFLCAEKSGYNINK